jgi:hypothetical protein
VFELTAHWRRADQPVAAHHLAEVLLDRAAYERTRGVAQQAARLARATRLPRAARAVLLCGAWLHDAGRALGPGHGPVLGARALRGAGHEDLARLVAHRGGSALDARLRGFPDVEDEFPVPAGAAQGLLTLLDVATVTTSAEGAPASPAALLAELRELLPPGDPAVRVLIDLVARLGEEPASRALVEHLALRATAG